jgi:hypothetical protein
VTPALKTKTLKAKPKLMSSFEQNWQSHASSETFNGQQHNVWQLSYHPHCLHQLPATDEGQWHALNIALSFCHKTGSNRKIQTWCWIAPKNLKEAGIINKNHEEVERTAKKRERKTKTKRKEKKT